MKSLSERGREPVPVELLGAALEAIADLPESRRDYTGRTIAVIRMLKARGLPDELRQEYSLGIQYRLQALSQLHQHPAYRAWSMKGDHHGLEYIHPDLVEAAATEPLVMGERDATFDPESFFNRVLKISGPDGNA